MDDDYGLLKMLILDKRLNLVGYTFEGYVSSKVTQTTFLDLSTI